MGVALYKLYKRAFRVFKNRHYAVEGDGNQTPNQMMMSSTHKTEGKHHNVKLLSALLICNATTPLNHGKLLHDNQSCEIHKLVKAYMVFVSVKCFPSITEIQEVHNCSRKD